MRILITGATGLIGREVGKRLSMSGHNLVVVSRNPERARRELPFPATVHKWEGAHRAFPRIALEGVEAVVHLAGESIAERWTPEKKKEIRDSRILGTKNLVAAILELPRKPKVLVSGSAIGIYGDRGDTLLDEGSAPGEGFLAGVVKDWEDEAEKLAPSGVRVVRMRTGIVLSRQGGALAKMLPVFSKGLGGKLVTGRQWMSWIHIDDIARAFIFALENEDIRGPVNGTAPEPARNDRFTISLARALGRSVFLPVPLFALKLALGEGAEALLASGRVLPRRLGDLGFEFEFPELNPALENLLAPLREGQHELVAEQWVPKKPEEIFPFFCDEKNLEVLTPPFLNFRVLGKSSPALATGTLINYRLRLHGIPVKWQSRIEDWKRGERFIDVQTRGPYEKWQHTHEFVPLAGGTLLRDRVVYRLPLGLVGDALAGWRVERDIAEIFAFRRKVIADRFYSPGEASS